MSIESLLFALLITLACGGLLYVFFEPYITGEYRLISRQKAYVGGAELGMLGDAPTSLRNKEKPVAVAPDSVATKKVGLEEKLEAAGINVNRNMFLMISIGAGAFAALISFLLLPNIYLAVGAFIVVSVFVPRFYVGYSAKRRNEKFVDELPNAVDVIVRGLKAGLPLSDSLRVIATEAAEPVSSEFLRVVEMQTAGIPLDEAMAHMTRRMPLPETNFLSIVIAIQSKSGGNLSEALSNLSKVIRERRKLKHKIIALSNEARISAIIVGSLPLFFTALISFIAPDYIKFLFETKTGIVVMICSVVWMIIGALVMRKMINFDY